MTRNGSKKYMSKQHVNNTTKNKVWKLFAIILNANPYGDSVHLIYHKYIYRVFRLPGTGHYIKEGRLK